MEFKATSCAKGSLVIRVLDEANCGPWIDLVVDRFVLINPTHYCRRVKNNFLD